MESVSSHKPIPGIKRRKMLISAAVMTAAVGVTVAGFGLIKRHQPVPEPIMQAGRKDPPKNEPPHPDAPVVVPAQPSPVHTAYSLEFKVSPAGVEVLKDGDVVCSGLPCSIRLDASHDPAVFTFRKAGYRERRESVVPDSDKSMEVTLEPLPRKKVKKDKPTEPAPNREDKSQVF